MPGTDKSTLTDNNIQIAYEIREIKEVGKESEKTNTEINLNENLNEGKDEKEVEEEFDPNKNFPLMDTKILFNFNTAQLFYCKKGKGYS